MAQKICIVGTGYVGLTTGVCLAFLGHEVTCVDLDQAKINALLAGGVPIFEPFLSGTHARGGREPELHDGLRG